MLATAGRRAFLILSLILAMTMTAGAQLPVIGVPSPPATGAPIPEIGGALLPVIVQISPGVNIASIVSTLGATLIDNIDGTNIYLLNVRIGPLVNPATVQSLGGIVPGIDWAELNTGVLLPSFAVYGIVAVPPTQAADWYKYQPAWQLIEAQQALGYSTGRGILIADINSQVDYRHPALVGHLTSGYDFVASRPAGSAVLNQSEAGFLDQSEAGFLDQSEAGFLEQSEAGFLDSVPLLNPAYSHGTLCAGVLAGIAPDSMIMPLRAFDDRGRSDLFTLTKAIRYGVQQGAQVINMSFGVRVAANSLRNAIQYAQQNNVLLAASAGNKNRSTPQYPAAYNGVMGIAATDLLDKKAAFSNYGRYIFVDAPGVNIISAYPGGFYGIVSGTSFSAPTVAATAALVRSLRISGVAGSIAAGAVNIDANNPGYENQLGYGRIDVCRSVNPNPNRCNVAGSN